MANDRAPVPQALYRDLLCLPIVDTLAEQNDYTARGYILLIGDDAVLFDTASPTHLPALRSLRERGRRLSALVLSHFHLIPDDGELARFARELDVPIFLHPIEADHPRAREAGVTFQDPTRSAALLALGVEVTHFPGHTAGSIVLTWGAHGGVLFTGDAALGPRSRDHRAGLDLVIRPPLSLNEDDAELRRSWAGYQRPLNGVVALHGEAILDRSRDLPALMAPLRRLEATPEFPLPAAALAG